MGDAAGGEPGRAGMCKLFVGNLPSDCTAEELRGAFSPFGPLVDVHMMSPARSRSGQACAFVLYANADAANYAIQSCNHKLKLRAEMLEPITVSFARGPGSSGPRAGGYFGGGAGGAPAGTPGMAGLQDCGAAGAGAAAFFGVGQLPGDAAAACAASMPGAAGSMATGQPVAAVGTVGAGAAMMPGGYGASLAGGSAAYGSFGAYGLPGAGGAYAPAAQYQPAAAVPGTAATVVPMAAFPQYVQYVQYPQGPTPQFAAQCAQPQYAAAGVQFGVAPQPAQAQFSQPCAQYAQAPMTAMAATPSVAGGVSVTTTDPQSTQCISTPAITGSTETPGSLAAPGAAVTTTPQPAQTAVQAAVEQQVDPQASSLQAQPAVQTQAQPQVQEAQQAQVQPQATQQPAEQTAAGGAVPSAAASVVAPGASPPAGSAKLLVGNLPGDIAPQTIEMVFATYGKVCSVRILPDKSPNGTSCALVEYETSHSAQVATVTLNGRYEIRVGFGFITVQPGDNVETPGQADQRYKPY